MKSIISSSHIQLEDDPKFLKSVISQSLHERISRDFLNNWSIWQTIGTIFSAIHLGG
jgi:hypothetical protein